MILHLPYEARMGGLCRAVGAIQLRDVKRFFELNVKINAKFDKCHWFDPSVVRWTSNLGQVEIRQPSVLPGGDFSSVASITDKMESQESL